MLTTLTLRQGDLIHDFLARGPTVLSLPLTRQMYDRSELNSSILILVNVAYDIVESEPVVSGMMASPILPFQRSSEQVSGFGPFSSLFGTTSNPSLKLNRPDLLYLASG